MSSDFQGVYQMSGVWRRVGDQHREGQAIYPLQSLGGGGVLRERGQIVTLFVYPQSSLLSSQTHASMPKPPGMELVSRYAHLIVRGRSVVAVGRRGDERRERNQTIAFQRMDRHQPGEQ